MSLKHPLPHAAAHAQELRKRSTEAEVTLWKAIRNRKFHGMKFRRQAPIGRFIADFLCVNPPFIIEIDGGIHREKKMQDAYRSKTIMDDYSFPVFRLSNDDVVKNLPSALRKIELFLEISPLSGSEEPPLSQKGRKESRE